MVQQAQELKEFPHFVVATPGRLASLFENADPEMMDAFQNLKYLVIDEADRIVNDQCFAPELKVILENIPA